MRHVNSAAGGNDRVNPCSLKFFPSKEELKLAFAVGSGVTLWDVGGAYSSSSSVALGQQYGLLSRISLPAKRNVNPS